jgi:hypothetical protein
MSVNTTDALAQHDVGIPDNVRIYLLSSTQHSPATVPSLGICQQLSNPAPYRDTMRALLVALERWVLKGTQPPKSRIPTLREGTLVAPGKASIGWPDIPGVRYTGILNQLNVRDYGPKFDARNESGILRLPPEVGKDYVMFVPKVDRDGNDIAGIRSTTIRAPLATYTGWGLRRAGFAEDELCASQGTFVPFKKTRAERLAVGDPRLSLEERYVDHAGYVAAVQGAADNLVAEGFLLPEDAARLVAAAEASDVLR